MTKRQIRPNLRSMLLAIYIYIYMMKKKSNVVWETYTGLIPFLCSFFLDTDLAAPVIGRTTDQRGINRCTTKFLSVAIDCNVTIFLPIRKQ